jgi:hypothetical protein
VGAGCSNVDDDCVTSTTGTNKGKGKSKKSDGTDCNTTSKSKSSKSHSVKSKTDSSSPNCTPVPVTLSISLIGDPPTKVGESATLTTSSDNSFETIELSAGSAACSVTQTPPRVTMTNIGSCTVLATQESSCSHQSGEDELEIEDIECPSPEGLSISGVQTSELVRNDVPVTLSGGFDFGTSPELAGTPGSVCSVSGSRVSFLAAGSCVLTYSQNGVCHVDDAQLTITVTGGSEECVAESYTSGTKTKYRLPDTSACQCYSVDSKDGTLQSANSKSQKSQCSSS